MGCNTRTVNGAAGFLEIGDTNLHSDKYEYIEVLEDAKFHVLNGNGNGMGVDPNPAVARVYLAGDSFSGRFTDIQLHSGYVRAYLKSN
jgi:hypothetical protein